MLLPKQTNNKISICVSALVMLFLLASCQGEKKRFDSWKWSWPNWWAKSQKQNNKQVNLSPAITESSPQIKIGKYFDVRILESTGNNECLQNIWSYLDELSPVSFDWQVLHKNGIRAGIGQYSDWPVLKQQLENCNTKMDSQIQLALGSFRSANLLTDKFRNSRTLFYYDNEGRFHGKDYGKSQLRLTITSAGKIAGNRVRIILAPKIVIPRAALGQITRIKKNKKKKKYTIEKELEKFSITIDLGAKEFVLVGISDLNLPDSLIGSQLFTQWKNGQKHSFFVLLSPMALDSNKNTKGK